MKISEKNLNNLELGTEKMKKSLYFECYSGISGDMTVAALLDLGADRTVLEKVLSSLPLPGFKIKTDRVSKSGIDACDFDVVLDEDNHDHDMAYLHGHENQEHTHHKTHSHSHNGHTHIHRGIKEIREIIDRGEMTPHARELALRIFEVLAQAEAKAHRVPVEDVHFHEVGAVDSIVDIISAAVCLDNLGIEEVIVPVLCEGRGTVRCQHGILPIPVPAVANIISENHLNIQFTDIQGELVTPTGAAIVAAVKTSDRLPEHFSIKKIGIGAGKRQYDCPGILRVMCIEEQSEERDTIIKMETNIDDCSGEVLGIVLEKLMKAGAKDVHYIPAYMKKNRPAWVLNVICREEDMEVLQEIIFRETTTIGIRYTKMERTVLKREQRTVETPLGTAEVKVCTFHGEEYCYPEYESAARLSRERGISYRKAYEIVLESFKEME